MVEIGIKLHDVYTERKVAEDLAGRLNSSLYMSIISAPVN